MIDGMAKTTSVPSVDLRAAVTVKGGGGYFLVRKDLLNLLIADGPDFLPQD
jgi:hypothetical protein